MKQRNGWVLVAVVIMLLVVALGCVKKPVERPPYKVGDCVEATEGVAVRITGVNPRDSSRFIINYGQGLTTDNYGKLRDGRSLEGAVATRL